MSERRPHKPTTRGVASHDHELTVPERVGARKPPTKPPPIPQKALDTAREPRTIIDPPRAPERPVFVSTSAKEGAPLPPPGAKPASASQPLRAISMKTPGELAAEKGAGKVQPDPRRMQIRELRPRHATPPQGLGRLAPPRDERETRVRRRQDLLIWGSVIVIVGSFVTLGIWFLAR